MGIFSASNACLSGWVEGTSLRLSNMMILQLLVFHIHNYTETFGDHFFGSRNHPNSMVRLLSRNNVLIAWRMILVPPMNLRGGSLGATWELWTSTLPAIDCYRLQLQQALAENRLGHRCLVYALEGGGGEGGQSHFMVVKGWCFQHFLGCFCFFLSRWVDLWLYNSCVVELEGQNDLEEGLLIAINSLKLIGKRFFISWVARVNPHGN